MRLRRTLALASAGGVALAGVMLAPTSSAAPGLTFGVPRIVDPIHVYGEPDLAENPKTGAIHASGPQGTGTQRSIWNVSVDHGDSYRIVQNLPTGTYPSSVIPTKSLIAPGGGDTEIQIAHNGRTFFNDLAALVCFSATTTTDDGATTAPANPTACSDPGADRQWIALFDPAGKKTISPYKGPTPLAYMEYAGQIIDGDIVSMSTDGVDYSHRAGIFADDGTHSPNHTPIIVDQYTGKLLGMTTAGADESLALAVGEPDANGDLTFHYNTVATNLVGDPQTLFPVLTEDTARNLYAVWVDHKTYQVWYSWARPGADNDWKTWSKPARLNTAPANVNVFPWAVAGGPGILDVAWYGTDWTLDRLGPDGPSEKKGQPWDLYFAQMTKANSTAPHVTQVKAAPHPMHYNDICLLGTLCITGQGNRNQADFFKVILGKDGRARIIYTDSSNRLSQLFNTDTSVDHQGAALDTVVTQNTGVNGWTGKPLAPYESTAPRASITDPRGDALFKPLGGTNVPGADITGVRLARGSSTLRVTVTTADGTLADAARAGGSPFGEIVVRWQMGDVLYDAGVEVDAASGTPRFWAGKTGTVDLCSVSGCKPNYMVYPAPPYGGSTADGKVSGNGHTYQIDVPLSAIGNPKPSSLLEEVMAFATVSPSTYSAPLDNARAFADVVPLQIEGTKTFNFSATAKGGTLPGHPGNGGSGNNHAGNGAGDNAAGGPTGPLADTGMSIALPLTGVLLLAAAAVLFRTRRRLTR